MDIQGVSDEELLARYLADRSSGQGQTWILELLQRYHNSLAYWCLRATGDAAAAERLAAEILEDVHRQLDSYPEGTLSRCGCLKSLKNTPRWKWRNGSSASGRKILEGRGMGNHLTRREDQILALIGLGKTSREIAAVLSISINTVNNHRKHICKKLALHSTGALVAFAAAAVSEHDHRAPEAPAASAA